MPTAVAWFAIDKLSKSRSSRLSAIIHRFKGRSSEYRPPTCSSFCKASLCKVSLCKAYFGCLPTPYRLTKQNLNFKHGDLPENQENSTCHITDPEQSDLGLLFVVCRRRRLGCPIAQSTRCMHPCSLFHSWILSFLLLLASFVLSFHPP